MNHAQEINKLIKYAAHRQDFQAQGYQNFESEPPTELSQKLQKANLFFSCSVLGMEAVSHVIEDQALTLGGEFQFYTAFQKISRMQRQAERYRKLAELGNPIFVFGVPDTELPLTAPALKLVKLEPAAIGEETSLSNNWFVVLHNPQFVSMALVAHELPTTNRPTRAPDKLVYRNFEGFWTYDRDVISTVVTILDDYIEQHQEN